MSDLYKTYLDDLEGESHWHVGCYIGRMAAIKSTCCYCGVGCGVLIETDGVRITGVRGDPEHPANFGRLCTKGATLHLTLDAASRAAYPELRANTGRTALRFISRVNC